MQYNWKLFKWNNGTDRTEFTEYLTVPIFLERRCNEQLSSGEVILDRMPINAYSKPFPPKTKFTLERWIGGLLETYFDFMVDHDDIEHYAGVPTICCHRVHLIEPSVFAQGLHCDNFALTYELKDVTLNYKTVISSDELSVPRITSIAGSGMTRPVWDYGGARFAVTGIVGWFSLGSKTSSHLYTNSFTYRWTETESLNTFARNLNGLVSKDIEFEMPILECYWNSGVAADKLFNCPVRCIVTRTTLQNGIAVNGSAIEIKNQLYSPTDVQGGDARVMYNSSGLVGLCGIKETTFTERSSGYGDDYATKVFRENEITNLSAMINLNDTNNTSRTVKFSTDTLTTEDFDKGLSYEYTVSLTIEPYQAGAFISQYTARVNTTHNPPPIPILFNSSCSYATSYTSYVTPDINSCTASVSFLCRNLLEDAPSNPFLKRGRPYNCYDLFRKAMLTCDTQIFDNSQIGLDEKYDDNFNDIGIQYPIEVEGGWMSRLKEATMFETIFENKNLWEIMQQIGHYIHAIPYLEFARNGKERFVLKFKQLGGTRRGNNDSNKITVFNSQTLDNFFTQYDSYVTNLFSPQNEVEEFLTCKTSDGSYLISNDTAEIHTKYNISEIVEFEISHNVLQKTSKATDYIFEKTIYDVLSSRTGLVPAKWMALYYQMGTNKILGLNYVPPTLNNDGRMALKNIVGRVFSDGVVDDNLKFNDLTFRIRYKTQDALRITQFRPDLERFMKSSEFEKYPHHEQFFNQQDKIVDSERFSANLWGRLIRVANGIYQCQEYARYGQEKEPGDLVELHNNGESYYVTECENEYYPDAIFQKVTYSKNFNQLSNIVTIPSEPRFFEVSERSMIRREVRLLDFVKLSTKEPSNAPPPRYINPSVWHEFIKDLLFEGKDRMNLPNFAYTNFKADKQRTHYNLSNNDISALFPSSESENVDGAAQPIPSASNRAVIVPVLHFPLRNAIVFEWDMDDNFKAGDCCDTTVSGNVPRTSSTISALVDSVTNFVETGEWEFSDEDSNDSAYYTMQPVRYCDVYGRADLFDFKLFASSGWSTKQTQRLPFAESSDFIPTDEQSIILIPSDLSIGLDKDNREALSFNYQLNLLHEPNDDDAGNFVTFANLFGDKNERFKAALLKNEVSMFSEVVEMGANEVVADNISYSFAKETNALRIDFQKPNGLDLTDVKSIVLYDTENTIRYAYIAKNVANLPNERKLQSWWIYPVFNEKM